MKDTLSDAQIDAFAKLRDCFDVPAPGSALELAWGNAMSVPDAVPGYVMACVGTLKAEIAALRSLLNEVRDACTRDDDLPDNLLPRIDAAMAQAVQLG